MSETSRLTREIAELPQHLSDLILLGTLTNDATLASLLRTDAFRPLHRPLPLPPRPLFFLSQDEQPMLA